MAEVSIDLLKKVLEEMEAMWYRIDGEWGPTKGGLERSIADGNEPEIKELRRLVSESPKASS